MHAMPAHPPATAGGCANHQARQLFVGLATGDLQQILPELLFRVRLKQYVLRAIMHAPQVTRVL
ncbi:hypothetical protein D3C81_925600 [compost metagenome]